MLSIQHGQKSDTGGTQHNPFHYPNNYGDYLNLGIDGFEGYTEEVKTLSQLAWLQRLHIIQTAKLAVRMNLLFCIVSPISIISC